MSVDKTIVAPRLPRAIGRYEITGRIGKGAMGVVYSARDGMMERTVAIKMMMTDLEDDPETSSRFYREARSAGQLVHPNIVTIFDMGQENGRPYIVMEYLEGETLNKYLARPEAADLEVKIDLMIQICQGLHAAHARGIYHRDIKPGNLLVRANGELKIVDFGIARLASSSMTASGLIMGTPDYMCPEQARGEEIDQRSDIFSTGAVFYFILTGRKPFAAPDLASVLLKVQTEDPLPIRESEAPPALTRIVMKALARDPAARYQTCARMMAELEHLKRELESQAIQQLNEADRRIAALEPLAAERRTLLEKLGVCPAPPDIDAARLALADRHGGITEPLRRTVIADLIAAVAAVEEPATAEVTRWRAAALAFDAGVQGMTEGETREAVAQLEEALRLEPAASRVSAEMDRCRDIVAEHRSNSDRAAALLDEARKAAASRQWQVVVGFCDDALELDADAAGASTLRETAQAAIADEARQRRRTAESALVRADAHRVNGRFPEAAIEIARAREADPGAPDIDGAEAKLKASIAEGERNTELARQSAKAIAAARGQFSGGQRDEAIAALQAFHAATGDAAAAAEISRMQIEARRIAAAEQRAAEAAALAAEAEGALNGGDPERALELGTRALAIDPAHVLARKISGLAGGEIKQRAEAQARAATAANHLEEARLQLARGKFEKARTLVSAAADLDPQNAEHKAVLAAIADEETRAQAAAARERILKQRAEAVAPILERARQAEAQDDMVRAAWLAENALALDLECREAKEIIRRVQAHIAANPTLTEDTVDVPTGRDVDPDDTASFTRPIHTGFWDKVIAVFRGRKSSDAARRTPAGGGSDSKGHTA